MSWNELSIREKADVIRNNVRRGKTSIDDIRGDYNPSSEEVESSSQKELPSATPSGYTPPSLALRYMKRFANGGSMENEVPVEILPEVEVRPTKKDYDYLRWAKNIIPDNQRDDSAIDRRVALFDGISDYYNYDTDKNPDDAIDRFQSAFALAGNPTISDWSVTGPIAKIVRGSQNAVSNYNPLTNTLNIHDPAYMQDIKDPATRRSFMSSEFLDKILAELPHAIQYQAEPIPVGSHNYLNRINGHEDEEYNTPGKSEWTAHSIIQPWLENDFLEGAFGTNDITKAIPALQASYKDAMNRYQRKMAASATHQFKDGGTMDEGEVEMLPEIEVRAGAEYSPLSRLQPQRVAFMEDNNGVSELPGIEVNADKSYSPDTHLTPEHIEEVKSEEPGVPSIEDTNEYIPSPKPEAELPSQQPITSISQLLSMKQAEEDGDIPVNQPLIEPQKQEETEEVKPQPEKELIPDTQRQEPVEPAKEAEPELTPQEALQYDSERESVIQEKPSLQLSINTDDIEDRVKELTRKNIGDFFSEKLHRQEPLTMEDFDHAMNVAKNAVYREERIKVAENIKRAVHQMVNQANPKLIRGMEDGYNCIYNVLSAFDNTYHSTGKGKRPETSNYNFRRNHSDYGFELIGNREQQRGFYFDRKKHSKMLRVGDVLSFNHPLEGWSHAVMVTGFDKDGEPLISYSHGRPKNEDDYKIYDNHDKSEAGRIYNKTMGRIIHEPTMVHNRRLSDAYKWEEDVKHEYDGNLKPQEKICVYRYTGNHNGVQSELQRVNEVYGKN